MGQVKKPKQLLDEKIIEAIKDFNETTGLTVDSYTVNYNEFASSPYYCTIEVS